MYIERVPNRNSHPTILLREAWREGSRIRKRTIANLSHWPEEKINSLKLLLRGEQMVPAGKSVAVESSFPYGHIMAILRTIRKTGADAAIATKPSRNRSLAIALVIDALISMNIPAYSHLTWHNRPLAAELKIEDACEQDFSHCLKWLSSRRHRIEKRLGLAQAYEQAGKYRTAPVTPRSSVGQGDFRTVSYDLQIKNRYELPAFSGISHRPGESSSPDGLRSAPDDVLAAGDTSILIPNLRSTQHPEDQSPHERHIDFSGGNSFMAGRYHNHSGDCINDLASYVEMRMKQALSPLIVPDGTRWERPFVHRSSSPAKPLTGEIPDSFMPMPFPALLAMLSTQCRNQCRIPSIQGSPSFMVLTEPSPLQAYAYRLIEERLCMHTYTDNRE
jgi:hypothetical protein